MKDKANWEPDEMGQLRVECWCGRTHVYVEPELLKLGLTRACGKERCKTIDALRHKGS